MLINWLSINMYRVTPIANSNFVRFHHELPETSVFFKDSFWLLLIASTGLSGPSSSIDNL